MVPTGRRRWGQARPGLGGLCLIGTPDLHAFAFFGLKMLVFVLGVLGSAGGAEAQAGFLATVLEPSVADPRPPPVPQTAMAD